MPFDAPVTLGPFSVAPDGRLAPRSADTTPSFMFRWRGRTLRAMLRDDPDTDVVLTLRAIVGRVPSTASDQLALRQQSFALLRALGTSMPSGWRVSLLPDHRVVLEATVQMPHPVTATSLLAETTRFVLALDPYVDLVEEAGMPAQA